MSTTNFEADASNYEEVNTFSPEAWQQLNLIKETQMEYSEEQREHAAKLLNELMAEGVGLRWCGGETVGCGWCVTKNNSHEFRIAEQPLPQRIIDATLKDRQAWCNLWQDRGVVFAYLSGQSIRDQFAFDGLQPEMYRVIEQTVPTEFYDLVETPAQSGRDQAAEWVKDLMRRGVKMFWREIAAQSWTTSADTDWHICNHYNIRDNFKIAAQGIPNRDDWRSWCRLWQSRGVEFYVDGYKGPKGYVFDLERTRYTIAEQAITTKFFETTMPEYSPKNPWALSKALHDKYRSGTPTADSLMASLQRHLDNGVMGLDRHRAYRWPKAFICTAASHAQSRRYGWAMGQALAKHKGKATLESMCECVHAVVHLPDAISLITDRLVAPLLRAKFKVPEEYIDRIINYGGRTTTGIVWMNQSWYNSHPLVRGHLLKVSEENSSQVAFFPALDKMQRQIYTRLSPGKYLTRFFGPNSGAPEGCRLSDLQIKTWAEKQMAAAGCVSTLHFKETEDEDGWLHVYENGPPSCMQGEDSIRVYCYPGNTLRLAYMEDENDDIRTRAIVREDKKEYIRAYPDPNRSDAKPDDALWQTHMVTALQNAGYTHGSLDGVKLQKIEHDDISNEYVCPYLDAGKRGVQRVKVMNSHLLVVDVGGYSATNVSGWLHDENGEDSGTTQCDDCGDRVDEDETTYTYSERPVCDRCCDRNYTYAYVRPNRQEYVDNNDVVECMSDNEMYYLYELDRFGIYECEVRNEYYHIDDLINCTVGDYRDQCIHVDESETDGLTDEVGHTDEFRLVRMADGTVVQTYIGYTAKDCLRNEWTRTDACIEIHLMQSGLNTVYYLPMDVKIADLLEVFGRDGDELAKLEDGAAPITEAFEPDNVYYGDRHTDYRMHDLLLNHFHLQQEPKICLPFRAESLELITA